MLAAAGSPALSRATVSGKFRNLQAVAPRGVGGHDAQAAGIGDDGHPVALGERLGGKSQGIVEQLLQGFHPEDAALGEQGVVGLVGAGQGPGVGRGGPGPGRGPPGLDGQDGLLVARLPGDLPGQLEKPLRVRQIFQVKHDDIRQGVILQVSQEVVFIEVGLVAHGHELGQPDPLPLGVFQGRHPHRAALGHQGDVPGGGHQPGKGAVEGDLGVGVDDAQAVGAQQANAVLPGGRKDQLLLLHPGAAQFLETRGDDDGRLDSLFPALLHDPGDQGAGHDDDAQVHGIGDVQDGREGLDAHDAGRLGVNRVDDPGVAVFEDVGKDRLAHAAGPAGGADDRHGPGRKEHAEILRSWFHDFAFLCNGRREIRPQCRPFSLTK